MVGEHVNDGGRVDLLGCNIAGMDGNDYGLLSTLDALLDSDGKNIDLAASADMTGNGIESNWLLEVGNIDASIYFNREALNLWVGDLATIVVTTNADSGVGSLRAAITTANGTAGVNDTITFSIAATSTITLTSALPTISGAGGLIIDGTTASGYSNFNRITINFNGNAGLSLGTGPNEIRGLQITGASGDGITLATGTNIVRDSVIRQNTGDGIQVNSGTASIYGNRIGVNSLGGSILANGAAGINITGGTVTVGGTGADANQISGNVNGITISAGTQTILANFIGTNFNGTAALGNTSNGILITGGTNHVIGNVGTGNIIAGNGATGVSITAGSAILRGNYIGLNPSGTAFTNVTGVSLSTTTASTIGGSITGEGNIISGNTTGINITNGTHTIYGNYIGTNPAGNAALANTTGINISGGSNHIIGGSAAGQRNVISGNSGNGISISTGSGITIRGNYIGLSANGLADLGNGSNGILITGGSGALIGGSAAGQGNYISGNTLNGLRVTGGTGMIIYGNTFGLASDNTTSVQNASQSINFDNGGSNIGAVVGGIGAGEGNVITNSGDLGVRVSITTGVSIRGNSIWNNQNMAIEHFFGGNNFQPGATLTSATYNQGTNTLTVNGTFTGTNGVSYVIDIYANPFEGGPTEAKDYLGSSGTITGTGSAAAFVITISGQAPAGTLSITSIVTRTSGIVESSQVSLPVTYSGPPTLSNSSNLNYTENQAPTAINSILTLTDPDGSNMTGATVAITGNFASGQDILGFVTQNGINGSYNAGTGVLTLSGNASPANYQTALRSVTYSNSSENPSALQRTVTYTVTDATGSSNQLTSLINVTPVNDPPINTIHGNQNFASQPQTTNEDTPLIFNSANNNLIEISDLDIGNAQATVTLTATNGLLTLSTINGLSFSPGVGDGVADATMTFTGNVTDIKAALNGLQFSPTANYFGSASIQITTNDNGNSGGAAQSDTDTVLITVNAVNDNPTATGGRTITYTENNAATIIDNTIVLNDIDNNNLAGATITISSGYINGQDILGFVNQNGINGSFNASNGTMTLSGNATIAQYQAALNSITYFNNSENPSGTPRQVSFVVNDGSGINNLSTPIVTTINVTPVNDAPVNTISTNIANQTNFSAHPQSTNEDTALVFNTSGNILAISDVDITTNLAEVTLTITHGLISLSGISGLAFDVGDGTNDATMTFRGTVANINNALNGLTYNPTANYFGSATLTIVTSDRGFSGTGGAQTDTDVVNITVNAQNDAPVLANGSSVTYVEDSAPIVINSGITLADVDLPDVNTVGTFSAIIWFSDYFDNTEDALVFANTPNITGSYNASTGELTLTGNDTLANYQAALRNVRYVNSSQDPLPIPREVRFIVNDGTANSNVIISNVDVEAVNDPPENRIDDNANFTNEPQSMNEDGSLVFNEANNNLIEIVDITLTITATATENSNGDFRTVVDTVDVEVVAVADDPTLEVQHTAGLEDTPIALHINSALTDTDGSETLSLVVSAIPVGAIITDGTAQNTFTATVGQTSVDITGWAYNSLTVTPPLNSHADFTLTVTATSSEANDGSTAPVVDTFNVTVDAVNDAPTIKNIPGAPIAIAEDTSHIITDLEIADVDVLEGDGKVQVELSVAHGTITLGATDGLLFTSGLNGQSSMIFTGLLSNVNLAIDSLTYKPNDNYNGADALQINVSDLGNSPGPAELVSTTIALSLTPVNDSPTLTVPGALIVDEDSIEAPIEGIVFSDPDEQYGAGSYTVTITVDDGTIAFGTTVGLTFNNGSTNFSGTLDVTGSFQSINDALASLNYTPDGDFSGVATINLVLDDNGSTGSGTNMIDTKDIAITVQETADAPDVIVPGPQHLVEDASLTAINGISFTSADEITSPGVEIYTAELEVSHGIIVLQVDSHLTYQEGTLNGTSRLLFTGKASDINNALKSLTYMAFPDYNGTDNLTVSVVNSESMGDNDSVLINIAPLNDAPRITPPATLSIAEDATATAFGAVTFTDVDGLSTTDYTVTLSISHGTLSLGTQSNLSFLVNTPKTLQFVGKYGAVTAALALINYAPDANYFGTDNLAISISDGGDTGFGGVQTGHANVLVNIASVNDAPVLYRPATATFQEDATATSVNGISFTDVENTSDALYTITLSATYGNINLAFTQGLELLNSTTYNSKNIQFRGNFTNINLALETLSYRPDANQNGSDSLAISVHDGSPNGLVSATTNITLGAINDAPTLIAPASLTLNEDASLTALNSISFDDVDEGMHPGSIYTVRLSVTNGIINLGTLAGLNQVSGANNSALYEFTGTKAAINTALGQLSYRPTAEYNGGDSLSILITDGATGAGGAMSISHNVAITVHAINDAPTVSVPLSITRTEDSSALNLTGLTFTDPDMVNSPNTHYTATVSVISGELNLTRTTGLTVTGSTVGSEVVFSGTRNSIIAALSRLTYRPNANFNGTDVMSFTINDGGTQGSGGALTDIKTANITVQAVNDAPVVTAPSSLTKVEDSSYTNVSGFLFSDVDNTSTSIYTVTLSATHGLLKLNSVAGLTFNPQNLNDSSNVIFSGTRNAIITALANLTYKPNANYSGSDSITYSVNDNGNGGSGGAKTVSKVVNLTISAANDTPTVVVPEALTMGEDTSARAVNGISFSDTDDPNGSATYTVSLSVSSGILNLTVNPNYITSGANGSASMQITTTGAALNSILTTLQYTPNANFYGQDTLTFTVNDGGASGTASGTVLMNVISINDIPHVSVGANIVMAEDGSARAISGLGFTDEENTGTQTYTATVQVSNGTLDVSVEGVTPAPMIQFTGTSQQITLLTYKPNEDFHGTDHLIFTVDDGGINGVVSNSLNIEVQPVNDQVQVSGPSSMTVLEGATYTRVGNINIGDADSALDSDAKYTAIIEVDHGTLSIQNQAQVQFQNSTANGGNYLEIKGTMAGINAALDSLNYQPDILYHGTDTLSIQVSDDGTTGVSGATTNTSIDIAITVNPANNTPTYTAPASFSLNPGATQGALSGIIASDPDEGNTAPSVYTATLRVNSGLLDLQLMGSTQFIEGTSGNSNFIKISGAIGDINASLASLIYKRLNGLIGADLIELGIADDGTAGVSGQPMSSTIFRSITLE
jgi:hypothetical protein